VDSRQIPYPPGGRCPLAATKVKPSRPGSGVGPGGSCPPGLPRLARVLMVARFGPGAAVADGVALGVGDRHAPGRPGVAGGRGGQLPGQIGVDGPNPVHLAGLALR
jgi:hypothetical protein